MFVTLSFLRKYLRICFGYQFMFYNNNSLIHKTFPYLCKVLARYLTIGCNYECYIFNLISVSFFWYIIFLAYIQIICWWWSPKHVMKSLNDIGIWLQIFLKNFVCATVSSTDNDEFVPCFTVSYLFAVFVPCYINHGPQSNFEEQG